MRRLNNDWIHDEMKHAYYHPVLDWYVSEDLVKSRLRSNKFIGITDDMILKDLNELLVIMLESRKRK